MTRLHTLPAILFAALTALLVAACAKVPSYVLQPDKMAEVMADVYVGESVVELNHRTYPNDSNKMTMLQSVYAAHGVTRQQVDTSLQWYSLHLDKYMDMNDRTIAILERRIAESGNRIAAENVSIAGDSVDIWNSARFLAINSLSPTKTLTFSFAADDNWERGDSYTWRAKFANNPETSVWAIVTEYDDGTTELRSDELTGEGWQEIRFVMDSTRNARRIAGYLTMNTKGATTTWLDSVMLVRNRLNDNGYTHQRRLTMRVIPKNPRPIVESEDSIPEE